jgi:hypothetical protein
MSMAPPACARRAWLTLGSLTMPLEGRGYFCTKLDLGSPTMREVVDNRPDQHGTIDRTALLGSRVVTIELTALAGAGARIDQVASAFAPFMDPAARPVLHYVLDRLDNPERVLPLRSSAFAWPIVGPYQRDVQLTFVAPDPVVRSPVVRQASAWAGMAGGPGRTYDLTFDRIYPPAAGMAITGFAANAGDLAAQPVVRVHGPGSHLLVDFWEASTTLVFDPTYTLGVGHYVDVDSLHRTVIDDAGVSCYEHVEWTNGARAALWPVIPVGGTHFSMSADGGSGITQAQVFWQEAYLS